MPRGPGGRRRCPGGRWRRQRHRGVQRAKVLRIRRQRPRRRGFGAFRIVGQWRLRVKPSKVRCDWRQRFDSPQSQYSLPGWGKTVQNNIHETLCVFFSTGTAKSLVGASAQRRPKRRRRRAPLLAPGRRVSKGVRPTDPRRTQGPRGCGFGGKGSGSSLLRERGAG